MKKKPTRLYERNIRNVESRQPKVEKKIKGANHGKQKI